MTTSFVDATDTQRLPVGSKASARGPGVPSPNVGLLMTTSGVLSPSPANIDARYRASGGASVVPPTTHRFPARSKVNPSEPPVFAATSADGEPVAATEAGANPSIVDPSGASPTPAHSLPLVGTSA